jgi:glutathione peroxidase
MRDPMLRFPASPFLALWLLACGAAEPTQSPADTPAAPPAAENAPANASTNQPSDPMDFYSLRTNSLDGKPADLASYRGKVALVVNVASECGFTPQYAGLQKLHAELAGRGFAVLGFPSNDFGGQEPGTPEQIRDFCTTRYKVDFPLFAKVQTKAGAGQSPVYALLGKEGGHLPNWNFCKYLVGKDGKVLGFYPSKVAPDDKTLRAAIDAALK